MNVCHAGRRIGGALLVVATVLSALYIGLTRPSYNWDIVGYLAAAHDVGGISDAALSRKTYGELRDALPPATFDQLIHGVGGVDAGYRHTVFRDPVSLAQQVPFYSIKWLYVAGIRALGSLGVGYVQASYVISTVCAALGVVLVFMLLRQLQLPTLALPFVIAYCGIITVGTLSTPDAMAALFALAGFYLAAVHSRWVYVPVALLPLVRPDLIILSVLLGAFLAKYRQPRWAAVSLAFSVGFYLMIRFGEHGYSWLELFNFSCIERTPYPASMAISTHVRDYVMPYVTMVSYVFYHPAFAGFGIAAIVLWRGRRRPVCAHELLFLAVPTAYTALHMLLFPEFRLRFFAAEAAVVFLYLLSRVEVLGIGSDAPAR